MAEVGTYYITVMPDMSKFTGGVNKALGNLGTEGGKKYSAGFLDVVKGSALGVALGSLAAKAGSAIVGGLSSGIQRLDIIQNFPKVMESLGYNADEAQSKISLIMERLDGLPTATQDVVTLTQAIADSTGDLDLATKAALGFNDMMLANGASSAEVVQAQGVLNRVLGKGSATVAQWQSLTSVMPAQLSAVARQLLGASASSEDLHEALEDGTVSWNDFLNAIVTLDTEGTDSMASFYEQAKANSHGIGTALENVQNRIGAGWANILDAIGREDISNAIDTMSYGVKDGMTRIAEGIGYVADLVRDSDIAKSLGAIAQSAGEFFSGLVSESDKEAIKDITKALVDLVDGALKWLADHGAVVKVALGGIVGAIAALVGFNIGTKLAAIPGLLSAIWTALSANPIVAIATIVAALAMALYTFFTQTEEGKAIWQGFCDLMTQLWERLQADWQALCEVLSRAWESFKAFIDGIPEWWDGVVQYWSDAMAEFGGYMAEAWQKLKDDVLAAWEALKEGAAERWEALKEAVTSRIQTAVETVTLAFDKLKATLSMVWDAIKASVTERVQATRQAIVDRFNAAKDAVLGVFDSIKQGIHDKLEAARQTVSNIIEGIKGLFKFEWSLPAPKLPHIDWHWNDIGGILTIPVFDGISWYAKGGVFDAATLIGIGEAGKEAALPLNRQTYSEMARGIVGEMGGKGAEPIIIEKLADTIIIRETADVDEVMDRINQRTRRERAGMA